MLFIWCIFLTHVVATSILTQASFQIDGLLAGDLNIMESVPHVITEQVVLQYESKNYNFLDEYFGKVYFGDYSDLENTIRKQKTSLWASRAVTYPDKDDITDIVSGRSDRYVSNPLSGFLSFAHLPLTNCFSGETKFDIGIVGATFDTGV